MKSPIARASALSAAAWEAARPAASSISVCFWVSSLCNMGASPAAGIFFSSHPKDQSLALGLRQHLGSDHDDHVRTPAKMPIASPRGMVLLKYPSSTGRRDRRLSGFPER